MATFYTDVDKERYDAGEKFLPLNRFLLNYTAPTENVAEKVTTSVGLPATKAFINSGGGGTYPGSTSQLLSDFNTATRARQKRLENPSWIQQAFSSLTGIKQRPVSEMVTGNVGNFSRMPIDTQNFGLDVLEDEGQYGPLRTFEKDQRLTSGMPLGIGSIISRALPDAYYTDYTLPEQAYTQLNMGYKGPTVFGENTSYFNKDIFGRNVRHGGKRSYVETQQRDIDRLDKTWGTENFDKKYGANVELEFDEESGQYMFKENGVLTANAIRANKMNKMNLTRYNYDKAGVLKFNAMNKQHQKNLAARKRWEEETRREQDEADKRFTGPHGTGDYDEYAGAGGTPTFTIHDPSTTAKGYTYEGSDEQDKANEGASNTGGASYSRPGTEGAPGHHWADGGRVGLRYGGLLSIL